MEDLLQSQIRESCRLALPEGLKDLMADISREVLRAQPQNLYQFIADYLASLLVAREHLFIAARVCDDVCKNRCCADLDGELRALSLNETDVKACMDIVSQFFSSGDVKETNLLQKLLQKTDIDTKILPAVLDAVRCAFLRHQFNKSTETESLSTDSNLDETTLAANHTLKLYKKVTESPDINYDCVASKIQAAYRAYNVRRIRKPGNKLRTNKAEEAVEKVRFHEKDVKAPVKERLMADLINPKRCASKCSSMSLAGSFLELPLYNPYSIGQRSDITEVDEVGEKETENANFDYLTNELGNPREMQSHKTETNKNKQELENMKGKKTISFHNLPHVVELDDNEVLDEAEEAEYESEELDENVLQEHFADGQNVEEIIEEVPCCDNDQDKILETQIISEFKGDGSESSETWAEDAVDKFRLDETEAISEVWDDNNMVARSKGDNSGRFNDNEDELIKSTTNTPIDIEDVADNILSKNVANNDDVTDALVAEDYENFLV